MKVLFVLLALCTFLVSASISPRCVWADDSVEALSEEHTSQDHLLLQKVKAALLQSRYALGSDITPSVYHSVVTLDGTVASAEQRKLVVDLVRGIPEVKSVEDRLEIQVPEKG